MLNRQIHDMLLAIAQQSYPDKVFKKFIISILNKQRKSFHGDWVPPDFANKKCAEIRIFNLERGTIATLKTAIHEMAHHVEYCLYGDTDHTKRFYHVLHKLLTTSIEMKLLTNSDANEIDATDIKMIVKYFGEIKAIPNPSIEYKRDILIVKVKNSFTFKDKLDARNYKWNPTEKVWMKELNELDLDIEKEYLLGLTTEENIIVSGYSDFQIGAIGYLHVIGETYPYRESLKSEGYIFKGFGFEKGNPWVKKILLEDAEEEMEMFETLPELKVSLKTR